MRSGEASSGVCMHVPSPIWLELSLISNLIDSLVIINIATPAFFFHRYCNSWRDSCFHMHSFTLLPNDKYITYSIWLMHFFAFFFYSNYLLSCLLKSVKYVSLNYREVHGSSLLPEALWVIPLLLSWQKHSMSGLG